MVVLIGWLVVYVLVGFLFLLEDVLIGVLIGMEILGRLFVEGLLLNIVNYIVEKFFVRRMLLFINGMVEVRVYESVLVIRLDMGNILGVYFIGVFWRGFGVYCFWYEWCKVSLYGECCELLIKNVVYFGKWCSDLLLDWLRYRVGWLFVWVFLWVWSCFWGYNLMVEFENNFYEGCF